MDTQKIERAKHVIAGRYQDAERNDSMAELMRLEGDKKLAKFYRQQAIDDRTVAYGMEFMFSILTGVAIE